MYIRFEQAREAPVAWDETVALSAVELGAAALLECGEMTCRGQAIAIDGGIGLHATLEGDWSLRCDRCLERFEARLETSIDLALLEKPPILEHSDEVELEEADFGTLNVNGDGFDTVVLIAEQVALSVPMKPLCRVDCAGLCPGCGQNLNRGRCNCDQASIDPRWRVLGALREGGS